MNIYLNGLNNHPTAKRSNVYSNDYGNPNHPTAKRSNVYSNDKWRYTNTTPSGSHNIGNITFLQTCNPFGIKNKIKYIVLKNEIIKKAKQQDNG